MEFKPKFHLGEAASEVTETAVAIRHAVRAFDYFKKENPLLNNLLDNVRLVLESEAMAIEARMGLLSVDNITLGAGGSASVSNVIVDNASPTPILIKTLSYNNSSPSSPHKSSRSSERKTRRVRFHDDLDFQGNSSQNLHQNQSQGQNQSQNQGHSQGSPRHSQGQGQGHSQGHCQPHSFTCHYADEPMATPTPMPSSSTSTKSKWNVNNYQKQQGSDPSGKLTWIDRINVQVDPEPDTTDLDHGEEQVGRAAQEEALSTTELLEHILGDLTLTPSNLKSCRSVSSQWNSIATKTLLTQEALQIKFRFDKDANAFTSGSGSNRGGANGSTLDALMDLLSKKAPTATENEKINPKFTTNFPCGYWSFAGGSLTNSNLQKFLSNYGQLVENLHFELLNPCVDSSDEPELMQNLKNLLTVQLPNLKSLKLDKFPSLWFDRSDLSQLFPEPRKKGNKNILQKLKSLHFLSPPPKKIFSDLLKASSSLESIGLYEKCDFMLPWLIEINFDKLSLLTDLEILLLPSCFNLYQNLSISIEKEKFALKIKKLSLNFEHYITKDTGRWYQATQIISKILNATSNTLEILHSQPLGRIDMSETKLPKIIPKLRVIRFLQWSSHKYNEMLFPQSIKLSSVFPNLEKIESTVLYYSYYYDRDSNWDKKFGASVENSVSSSVTDLSFKCGPPSTGWLLNFCTMFPNLKILKLGLMEDFEEGAKGLWSLEKIENLQFFIEIGHCNKYPGIDSGFTGFSKENCFKIYETSRDVDFATVEELRENPSIIDAKCLRKLHFTIYDSSRSKNSSTTVPFLSHVTGVFAFQRCPKLQVEVSVGADNEFNLKCIKNGLSPILPYVQAVTDARRPYDNNNLP